MPKLWDDTIDAHRREVGRAIEDATAALVAEDGLLSVTMSKIAVEAGIGRATLYKYFSGVDDILLAWHERQVRGHLDQVSAVARGSGSAGQRVHAVLSVLASIQHLRGIHHAHAGGDDLTAVLHRGQPMVVAERDLHALLEALVAEAAAAGEVRSDVPTMELTSFCLHALDTAGGLPSEGAVSRLVALVMDGLRSPA